MNRTEGGAPSGSGRVEGVDGDRDVPRESPGTGAPSGSDAVNGTDAPNTVDRLSDRDHPGMPAGATAWDERSREWLTGAVAHAGPAAEGHADAGAADSAPPARPGPDAAPGGTRTTPFRRGTADPVKTLLHRHRDLCERAVDPLEIAAGLEAHGVTDRTAARFRHRDVFSLAEELYARVPRDGAPNTRPEPGRGPRVRAGWVLLTLLPGALAAAALTVLRLTHGRSRPLVAAVGLLALAAATRAALRRGPLAAVPGRVPWRTAAATRAWTLWLLGYALLGDGLLEAVVAGGPDALPTGAPDGPWPMTAAPALALTLACAPAAWCAHLLAAGARRRLAGSRGLEDFTSAARPLLAGVLVLFLGALTGLLALCGTALHESAALPQGLALGALLLLARLLVAHRRRRAPEFALGAAAVTEAAALALLLAARLPGCAFLAAPVQTVVDAWGPAAVPTLVCGAAALALLVHALRTLTRASAHAPAGAPE
ncbi:hypothetical protein ABZ478_05785 [Streptomyces sp. NPDC005706]|uniref:hypothetical protein n=1 Tax=Streptomyces sp. NPDC005706 TaxID=3157169 RepID=UPI0033E9A8D0